MILRSYLFFPDFVLQLLVKEFRSNNWNVPSGITDVLMVYKNFSNKHHQLHKIRSKWVTSKCPNTILHQDNIYNHKCVIITPMYRSWFISRLIALIWSNCCDNLHFILLIWKVLIEYYWKHQFVEILAGLEVLWKVPSIILLHF